MNISKRKCKNIPQIPSVNIVYHQVPWGMGKVGFVVNVKK